MSGIWPGDTQCVAMLTFDVDGVSSWLWRDPNFAKFPSLMSMAEYGPAVAAPRILDLLDDYGIKASFYVPGYVAETHVALVEDIANGGAMRWGITAICTSRRATWSRSRNGRFWRRAAKF